MAATKKTRSKKHKICVVGAGHVGLVAAACFAELGHKVICEDASKQRITDLKKLKMPFFEPELEALVKKNVKKGHLTFSYSLDNAVKKSDVIFLAVGTPPLADGSADLTSVENVARTIAFNLNSYKIIVEKSTVPVQTGQKIKETINRYRHGSVEFDIASNPEFLREGKAVYDFFYPDRIVIGTESKRAAIILKDIYAGLKAPIIVTNINTAELIKHASNSFLAAKISFINAVSRVCDLAGADVDMVASAMGMDKRIGKSFLNAGIGYGGFCFPKDLEAFHYIASKLGYDFGLLKEVKRINDEQQLYFVEKVKERLWVLKDKHIAILGLAFKADTDDMRFAPSEGIVRYFLEQGAIVTAYDPQAMNEAKQLFGKGTLRYAKNAYEAVKDAECACFLTEWDEFRGLDFKKIKKRMRFPLVADGRNMFNRDQMQRLGFEYLRIGG
ncbi:MAG: UDP-glucose/GDP-mannose dehydrogenase family protein [Candidatus Omnitrophota bacterium]|nr:MAG: UDP-glucose/GDP-mannose dehydrogenase family protein [Candidatus Omnitrophota bacterium]